MDNTDKDALTWAGDEARMRGSGTWSVPQRDGGASSSDVSTENATPAATVGGHATTESSKADESAAAESSTEGESSAGESARERTTWRESVALLVTGVFAGVYLLITAAWLITALRNPITIADPLGNAMFIVTLWLAVAAGPIIFVVILSVRRGVLVRFLLLLLAALVLIPWPYLTWVG